MTEKVLHVAFVWNQHQPYYYDEEYNELIMPWVRLHSAKDYFRMAEILEEYPRVKQTFSLSPSLLEQLQRYVDNGVGDTYLNAMKKVNELDEKDKRFLLLHYFDIQWDRVISRHPPYRELLEKQGYISEPEDIEPAVNSFSDQQYLDLQVWFNLCWIDPEIRERDPFLKGLLEKGSGFSENDKEGVIERHYRIMEEIVPVHRLLQQKGNVEMITTAFYHPILPLLVDNHSVLRATPGLPLPRRFSFPEDARIQIDMAVKKHVSFFGVEPKGLWPPEQAVSPELIPMLADQGIRWTISDEQILSRSAGAEIYRDGYGHVLNPDFLYRSYLVSGEGTEIAMVFRDQHLSDRIGFEYQHMSGSEAAEDLVHRLHVIREKLAKTPGEHLVTLSLDGENAWEWYPADKTEFLHALYGKLTGDPHLETVTVGEFIELYHPARRLSSLATGSWVDRTLTRWIGTDNKNRLWDFLLQAREEVQETEKKADMDPQKVEQALMNIYKAQGSDFNWWVDSMPYYLAAPFESLFRRHLVNVYHSLGLTAPDHLYHPVLEPPEKEKGRSFHFEAPVTIARGKKDE